MPEQGPRWGAPQRRQAPPAPVPVPDTGHTEPPSSPHDDLERLLDRREARAGGPDSRHVDHESGEV